MEKLKVLQQQNREIQAQIDEITQAETDRQNTAHIGKCFRYRNSYGCPREDERWWFYLKVLGVQGGALVTHCFQTDCYGRIEIEPEKAKFGMLGDNYQEIPESEFDAAWALLLSKINSIG